MDNPLHMLLLLLLLLAGGPGLASIPEINNSASNTVRRQRVNSGSRCAVHLSWMR